MSNIMLAHCGLDCSQCDAYLATFKNDSELKTQTAEKWSAQYGGNFKAQDINCMGCRSDGPHFSHCSNCEIRSCSFSKGYENCGQCPDFSCQKVEHVLKHDPGARHRLTGTA
ncbi:MAG: DUF3795 domain-containing protein [Chitinispirillia bacterium]